MPSSNVYAGTVGGISVGTISAQQISKARRKLESHDIYAEKAVEMFGEAARTCPNARKKAKQEMYGAMYGGFSKYFETYLADVYSEPNRPAASEHREDAVYSWGGDIPCGLFDSLLPAAEAETVSADRDDLESVRLASGGVTFYTGDVHANRVPLEPVPIEEELPSFRSMGIRTGRRMGRSTLYPYVYPTWIDELEGDAHGGN